MTDDRGRSRAEHDIRAKLLEAGRADPPPTGARSRALIALGFGAVATSATGVVGAATSLAAKAAPIAKVLLVAKWVGLGAGAALLSVGAANRWVAPSRQPAPSQAALAEGSGRRAGTRPARTVGPSPETATPTSVPVVPTYSEPAAPTTISAAPQEPPSVRAVTGSGAPTAMLASGVTDQVVARPAMVDAPYGAASQRTAPAAETDARRALGREIAELDAARRKLASGAALQALTILDSYAKEFPEGELAPEATLLRVEALQGTGQRSDAERLARQFLREHPTTPHKTQFERSLQMLTIEPVSISRSIPSAAGN